MKQQLSEISEIAVFDLETTGVEYDQARIVTSFVGVMGRDGKLTRSRSWLVDPGIDIPAEASRVNGITTEHARENGQDAAEAVAELRDELAEQLAAGVPVVAFNARFDVTILDREIRRHGLTPVEPFRPVVDPFVIDKRLDTYRRGSRTLSATAAHYGVSLVDAHDAEADATATGQLAWKLIDLTLARFRDMPVLRFHDRQVQHAAQQADSFEAYRRLNGDQEYTADREWPLVPWVQ